MQKVSPQDTEENPKDKDFWRVELQASHERVKKWHKLAGKIVKRYIDDRSGEVEVTKNRLNLFHSNVTTLYNMFYGRTPKIDVSRKYLDSSDDVARVAADILERVLNNDIADNGAEYDSIMRGVLQDRLLPGLGVARVRYEVEMEDVEIPETRDEISGVLLQEATTVKQLVSEDAPVDYFHWRDVRWGWGRTFSTLPWVAFGSYISEKEAKARFGSSKADDLEYAVQKPSSGKDEEESDSDLNSAWNRALVWEVWSKEDETVYWIANDSGTVLDSKPDTLQVSGFFPCPPFLLANPTTTLYHPTPDYKMAEDLYNEIDLLQSRISTITEAVKVVGVYDKASTGIQRMLKEGTENDLIPVENWALFAEKGGIKGQIDWMPLTDIVTALDKLRALRDDQIALLHQITGMSDLMRGELDNGYEGVGQSQIKAKFGSVRTQALQDQYADFATDLMQLKAEVILKHFDPQTIVARANMRFSLDAELIPQAIELLRDPDAVKLRCIIRADSMALIDYSNIKQERGEYITALSTFMQSASGILNLDPSMKPLLLQMLQWGMAGYKGAGEIEGVLDKAIEQAKQSQQNQQQKPDPEQAKLQAQMMLQQAKMQGEMAKIKAKSQADLAVRQSDLEADIKTAQAQLQADLQTIQAELNAELEQINTKLQADIQLESIQSQINVQQALAGTQAEIEKERIKGSIAIEVEHGKAAVRRQAGVNSG